MEALHKHLLFRVLTLLIFVARDSGIVRGEKVPENSMRYMVSLQDNRGRHVCGGFLISKDFVVTAANCDTLFSLVVLGTHNLRRVNSEKIRHIEKRYKHPSYVNVGYGNDIMLLQLSDEVPLGESVQLIQLPDSTKSTKENDMCHVAGWGATETSNRLAVDDLRVVDVSIIDLKVCKDKWPGLPDNVICAGGFGTNKGFCQDDSGGPLVCNGTAVGVVSFNKNANCNYPDVPNVYTDISKFLLWVKKILSENALREKSNFCLL